MSLDPKRDLILDAGAALREAGLVISPAQRVLSEAVYQVGQAVYGRNSGNPTLQRQALRSALKLVGKARKIKGAPGNLPTAEMLLRIALRNLKPGR